MTADGKAVIVLNVPSLKTISSKYEHGADRFQVRDSACKISI